MKYREVPVGSVGAAWQIRLFGEFKLLRPDGTEAALRNRKCEGLIALLAANGLHGVSRDYLGAALWPDSPPEKQRESLRQAIAIVRRTAGTDLIAASRVHCRLSDSQGFECDLDHLDLRAGVAFMPGQVGEWFDQMRLQMEDDSQDESSVMSQFLGTLRWCASYDPASLFAFLRTNPALVRGLPFGQILSLLASAGNPAGSSGWADYWRGVAGEDLDLCAVSLRKALRQAVADEEWSLASDACFELGKVHSRRGGSVKAQRAADLAVELAEKANSQAARINATRLKGTILLHWGEPKEGLGLLRQSANLVDDPVRRAVMETSQAWFEAASGMYVRAARSLEFGDSLWRETGHRQVRVLTLMTRAVLTIHEGARASAVPNLEQIARQSYESGDSQFGVYAEELLAKLHHLSGERQLSAGRVASARANRLKSRMARTPLEVSMIAAIK